MITWPCMPIPTPHQATAAPGTLISGAGAVGNCWDETKTGKCPGAAPLYSLREVVSNFETMLKPWGGQENYPCFPKMRQ